MPNAGIDNTLDNSASYIASWLKHLQNDKKMIFSAASKAQKAVDYISISLKICKLELCLA